MLYFTRSEIATWQECQAKHGILYELGIKHAETRSQGRGSRMHEELAKIWRSRISGETYVPPSGCPPLEWALLSAYNWRWREPDEKLLKIPQNKLLIGEIVPLRLNDEYTILCEFDALVLSKEGAPIIYDWKTTSHVISLGSPWAHSRARSDLQASIYLMAMPEAHMVFDAIHVPRSKPLMKETDEAFRTRMFDRITGNTPEFFRRFMSLRTAEEQERIRVELIATCAHIERDSQRMIRTPGACSSAYGECASYGICWEGADLANYERRKSHTTEIYEKWRLQEAGPVEA